MLSRFHLIPERHGQTDGQTDRFAISISRVSVLTRDKKTTDRHEASRGLSATAELLVIKTTTHGYINQPYFSFTENCTRKAVRLRSCSVR